MSSVALGQTTRDENWLGWDDAELVDAATRGEMGAFAELYRRHADRAWRVARRVVENEDDAHDAVAEAFASVLRMLRTNGPRQKVDFGPYLLVATRHAAVSVVRTKARMAPTSNLDTLDSATASDQPGERAVSDENSRFITQALAALPERERLVLWLVEVEDKSLRNAATVLGVKPNHVAQIAMRARKRLRKRYVQAHLRNHAPAACAFSIQHLPAYLDRELSQHSLEKIDAHLSGCLDCQGRVDELRDLGLALRRAVLLPSLLGARLPKWWRHRVRTRVGSRRGTVAVDNLSTNVRPHGGVLASVSGGLARGPGGLLPLTGSITQAFGANASALQGFVAAAAAATVLVFGVSTLEGWVGSGAGSSPHSGEAPVATSAFDAPGGVGPGQWPSNSVAAGSSQDRVGVLPLRPEAPATPSGPPADSGPGGPTGLDGVYGLNAPTLR